MDDLDRKIADDVAEALASHPYGVTPTETIRLAVGIALRIADARYQPRADVKPDALAPDDATEEAIGIVARAKGRTVDGVKHDMRLDIDGTESRLVREIAAEFRRRSGVRIGTGAIAETVIHDDANGLIARAERKRNGDVLLSYDYTERTRGRATLLPADAFRALVALMARDGEGR